MTYTLTLTPYLAAQLAACCLHAGLDVRNIFPAHISGHTAPTPAAESPAVLPALGLPAPVAADIPPAPVYENDEDFLASLSLREPLTPSPHRHAHRTV